jgi:hypothetical protein
MREGKKGRKRETERRWEGKGGKKKEKRVNSE